MSQIITITCNEAGGMERKIARNYLVIPQNRRVYLIAPGAAGSREVLALCREILNREGENVTVYVYVNRGGELPLILKHRFVGEDRIRPVIVGKGTEQFLKAADVVLTRSKVLLSPEEAPQKKEKKQLLIASSVKEAISKAKRFLDGSKKMEKRE